MREQYISIPHKVLLTKNGNIIWITAEKAREFEQAIVGQTVHRFIRIKELDRTINTAEVAEVMTEPQYNDFIRIKKGDYQCKWKKWHTKKEECNCQKEEYKRQEEEKRREEERELNREQTPEERERVRKKLQEIKNNLIEKKTL